MTSIHTLLGNARAIVFDLDGTLVDTFDDLWMALNDALAACALPPADRSSVMADIHRGLDETARGILQQRGEAPRLQDKVVAAYRKRYRQRAHGGSRLYDGVGEFLAVCRSRGQSLGICTNKLAADARDLIERLGIANRFDVVTGIDDCGAAKPDPAPLLKTLERLGHGPSDAIFIGDSGIDAGCAKAAGVPFLLHEAGFGSADAILIGCSGKFGSYRDLLGPR